MDICVTQHWLLVLNSIDIGLIGVSGQLTNTRTKVVFIGLSSLEMLKSCQVDSFQCLHSYTMAVKMMTFNFNGHISCWCVTAYIHTGPIVWYGFSPVWSPTFPWDTEYPVTIGTVYIHTGPLWVWYGFSPVWSPTCPWDKEYPVTVHPI